MSARQPPDRWVEEDQQGVLRVRYRAKRTLFSAKSEYQQVDIVETPGFGRMLFTDGSAMLSERDERVYHEMIAHVPLFARPGIRRVLVIGGGDGGTVREVLRHPGIEICRLVEIDETVVEACRRHLPQTAAALDDPRVDVRIEDGLTHVERGDECYDLVLVDSNDPEGPAEPLFGTRFYANVQRVLSDGGIVVSHAHSPFYNLSEQEGLLRILEEHFRYVRIYNYSNLTYPGGLWSFTFAGKGDLCPVADLDPARVERSGLDFHYYNARVHRAAFSLPQFQLDRLRPLLTPESGRPSRPADR